MPLEWKRFAGYQILSGWRSRFKRPQRIWRLDLLLVLNLTTTSIVNLLDNHLRYSLCSLKSMYSGIQRANSVLTPLSSRYRSISSCKSSSRLPNGGPVWRFLFAHSSSAVWASASSGLGKYETLSIKTCPSWMSVSIRSAPLPLFSIVTSTLAGKPGRCSSSSAFANSSSSSSGLSPGATRSTGAALKLPSFVRPCAVVSLDCAPPDWVSARSLSSSSYWALSSAYASGSCSGTTSAMEKEILILFGYE